MAGVDLLRQADVAGLIVFTEGSQLVIRGPRSAAAVARLLIEHKSAVMAELANRERRAVRREAREWSADERAILGWYAANRDRTPPAPFALGPGAGVSDRGKFLRALDGDVKAGPNGPRAAVLADDLLALRRVVEATIPLSSEAA